jgi:type VI protein secretion system component VasK
MSWHTDQLKYALGLGGLVTFYGLISLIVFVGGQQFGLKLTEQIVIVAIVLLTLPFALVIGYFLTRSKKPKETDESAAAPSAPEMANGNGNNGQSAAPQKMNAPSGKYEELTANADTAISFLKTSNLSGAKGAEALYSLPFFVFAGAPRSGKTSLVLSSGLNFQALPNQRQSEQSVVRPTLSNRRRSGC